MVSVQCEQSSCVRAVSQRSLSREVIDDLAGRLAADEGREFFDAGFRDFMNWRNSSAILVILYRPMTWFIDWRRHNNSDRSASVLFKEIRALPAGPGITSLGSA